MDDLQLTKEFKEATAVICCDILQNPQKYKQAGKWLDQYFFYDNATSWQKMLKYSERIVSLYFPFPDSDKGCSFLLPDEDDKCRRTIRQLVQAIAVIELSKFFQLSDIYLTEDDLEALERDFTKERIVELSYKTPNGLCEKCQKKNVIPSKYKLWLACKEILEIKQRCTFIGQEESVIVCLLTWLLTGPDAHRAALGITEFEKWEWYSSNESEICSQRADVIQLLHTCKILQDWQNLACEAWQSIRGVDGKTEAPTKGASSSESSQKTSPEGKDMDFHRMSEQLVRIANTIEAFAKGGMYSSDAESFREIRKPVENLDMSISILCTEATNNVRPFAQRFAWVLERLGKSVSAIEHSMPPCSSILLLDSQEIRPAIQMAKAKVRQDFEKVKAEYCEVLKELARPNDTGTKPRSKKTRHESKYTPEKIKNMLVSYDKHLHEKNGVKYAWNCVAEEQGIPSGKAAEMAVRRYQKKNK